MTGADFVVQRLLSLGVERVFTLCGNGLDPFYDACDRAGLALVDTHNEQSAGYMADAHGRLTGRLAVCAVSSGVAHINALTGVVNAHFDGAPMLLITGASEQTTYGLGHFQELDQVALADPICKLARRVESPDRLEHALDQAYAAAMSGRPGPVHLTIPLDVFQAQIPEPMAVKDSSESHTAILGPVDSDLIEKAADLLEAAQRPLIVAGSGVFYSGAEQALADVTAVADVPIVIPIWDRGCIGHSCRQFVGFVGPASGEPRLLVDVDLIIMVGAEVDYRVGYLRPPAVRQDLRVIRISVKIGERTEGRQPDVEIFGDPGWVLRELKDRVRRKHTSWCDQANRRAVEFRAHWSGLPISQNGRLTGRGLVEILKPFITDDTIFLIDGGDIGQWAHMILGDRYPGHWLTCGASAVVGYGLPGAIAAKLAYPNRAVILLSGDGAAGFTIAELEVAVRQQTPIVMVVTDNQAWGIVVAGHRRSFGRTIACEFGPIRYDQVAEGFGAHGVRTEDPDQLKAALQQALASDRPTLIHVPIAKCSPTDHPPTQTGDG